MSFLPPGIFPGGTPGRTLAAAAGPTAEARRALSERGGRPRAESMLLLRVPAESAAHRRSSAKKSRIVVAVRTLETSDPLLEGG